MAFVVLKISRATFSSLIGRNLLALQLYVHKERETLRKRGDGNFSCRFAVGTLLITDPEAVSG